MTNHSISVKDGDVPIVVPESMVVFAGHPDDELLSAGGTIMKYSELGTKITVVVATMGLGGYAHKINEDNISNKRANEFESVTKFLNCDFVEIGLDEISINRQNVAQFTNLIRDLKPQVILMHHPSDTHRTHRNLANLVKEAIYHTATGKAYGGAGREFMPLAVYQYESPSCKFQYIDASVFITVDISNYWERKIEIFKKVYASQAEVLDRILLWAERTAKLRGNEYHCEYGEAFIPLTEYVPLKILLQ